MENKFFKVGDFCLNQDCPDYGVLQKNKSKPNIKKFGSTKAGRQRYQCKTCGKTFTERKGTIFCRKKHSEKEIMEALAMIAEGSRISSVSRIKGYKEDTISSWIQQAWIFHEYSQTGGSSKTRLKIKAQRQSSALKSPKSL